MVARIHGHSLYDSEGRRSPTYNVWSMMKDRCLNPNNKCFNRYGGRGISVCERWLTFANFLSDMGEQIAGTSLDRIDNSKGYSPENCRWATQPEQQRNKRSTRKATYKGETKPVIEWCEILGLDYRVALRRLNLGDPAEVAFEVASHPPRPAQKFDSETIAAAKASTGPARVVAAKLGMSESYVLLLRRGKNRVKG